MFADSNLRVYTVTNYGETQLVFNRLISEAQAFYRRPILTADSEITHTNDHMKICLLGGDMLINLILRAYVDQLSARSSELVGVFRFFIIPVVGLCRQFFRSDDQFRSDSFPFCHYQDFNPNPTLIKVTTIPTTTTEGFNLINTLTKNSTKSVQENRLNKKNKGSTDLAGPFNESNLNQNSSKFELYFLI